MADFFTPLAEVPKIVAKLRRNTRLGLTRPVEWRRRQLKALKRMLEENEDAIVQAMLADFRKPPAETLMMEVYDTLGEISFFLHNLEALARKEILPTPLMLKPLSYQAWREPVGVVTVIAPWNFPFALLFNPLAGALAAGNACILKPSEVTQACNRLVADLVAKYFDSTDVAVVSGGPEETTALLAEKVDHIMYTGNAQVGRIVMAAAAKNLTPVTLELGGKSPAYVDESANLQVSARRILFAKNANNGQVCVATDYALVHEKVRDAFVQQVLKEFRRLYPGDEQANPDKARVVNDRHFQRIADLLHDHGGTVVCGGKTVEADRFVEFTVIVDPSPDSALMREEIFGPILPVLTVKSVEEALEFCNARPVPLAAYVFDRDPIVRRKWLEQISAGGVSVNDFLYHVINKEGQLGGKGESGMGATRGRTAFNTFSHRKVVAIQAANFDPLIKYPPYPEKDAPRLLKMILIGDLPDWVVWVRRGVVGAMLAGLLTLLCKHVSISVASNALTVSLH